MKLFVEGGGDYKSLRAKCREGFTSFFEKTGLVGQMPRVVASGSRQNAYNDFCMAIENNEAAMLLVDSEDIPQGYDDRPWAFLFARAGDKWKRPEKATDGQCHLMVVCMESWFLADPEALAQFFGPGFNTKDLPKGPVETICKTRLFDCLKKATKNCKSKEYHKGRDSFKILALLDSQKVQTASPWAKRLVDSLKSSSSLR